MTPNLVELEQLAVRVLHDFRLRDGLTCYAHDRNRLKDEANMKAAFAEIVAPALRSRSLTDEER